MEGRERERERERERGVCVGVGGGGGGAEVDNLVLLLNTFDNKTNCSCL